MDVRQDIFINKNILLVLYYIAVKMFHYTSSMFQNLTILVILS